MSKSLSWKRRLKKLSVVSMLCFPFVMLSVQLHSAFDMIPSGPSIESLPQMEQNPNRPLLRTILDFNTSKIVGDPNFLLDFAVIGFPKCGTTALHDWFSQHEQIEMLKGEAFPLMYNKPELPIWRLYTQLPASPDNLVRGYKNPLDIRAPPSLRGLAKFFPKTLLIVGIRHPVLWFESLYNFKVQNLPLNVDPSYWGDPNMLVDACEDWYDTHCVGTDKGWFHTHLAALGKVPFPESWRNEYPRYLQNVTEQTRVPNPVFLYETSQLEFSAQNSESKQFVDDLQALLGLETPLPSTIPRTKPDFDHFNKRHQRKRDRNKIRICEEKYTPLRKSLMDVAQRSSQWIRSSFLKSPDVHVSSPDHFHRLLENWMQDPCANRTQ